MKCAWQSMKMIPVRAWRVTFSSSQIKWILLVAGVVGCVFAWTGRSVGVTYWPQTSARIVFNAQLVISMACLGFAAWQARGDKNPVVAELAQSFPVSRALQLVMNWSSLVGWGLLAYAFTVTISISILAPYASWGYPDWQPLLQGAAVIVCATSVGYTLGWFLPTFILIPVWMIGWFVLDGWLPLRDSSIRWAAPRSMYEAVDRSIFRESVPAYLDLKQAGWLLAASVLVLSLCLLSVERTRRIVLMSIATVLTVVVTSAILFSTPPTVQYGTGAPRAFELYCEHSEIVSVCLHPAERPLVGEILDALTRILEPVAGFSSVPKEFTDSELAQHKASQGAIYVSSREQIELNVAEAVATALFPSNAEVVVLTRHQAAVLTALHTRAGYAYESAPYWMYTLSESVVFYSIGDAHTEIIDLARALGQTSLDEQRQWLQEYWLDLQSGDDSVIFP